MRRAWQNGLQRTENGIEKFASICLNNPHPNRLANRQSQPKSKIAKRFECNEIEDSNRTYIVHSGHALKSRQNSSSWLLKFHFDGRIGRIFMNLKSFVSILAFSSAALFPGNIFAQSKPPIPTASGQVVRYYTTMDLVKYVYATAPPVARLHPGDILETNTPDAFGNAVQKPGDTLALVKGDNPLAGPFYVEGAEPGDTLIVRFLKVEVDGNQGIGAMAPGFGAVNSTGYTPMLNPPLPEKIWFYPIDHSTNTATYQALDSNFTVKIPLHPFIGCIGVAPAGGEARSSVVPAENGGNMDAPEASVGNTLYLPVNAPGALLYLGDGHAAMGDGEVDGTAIEVPLRIRLQVDLLKGKRIAWPRFENDNEIMAAGIYRPVDDALRIAVSELVYWINADYGLSQLDAYELLSKVGHIHLTEMVDPNYVIIASIDKKFLPPRKKGT
jgi:amidase